MVGFAVQRGLCAAGHVRLFAGLARRVGHGGEFVVGGDERFAPCVTPVSTLGKTMDILYLLIPLSVTLVFFILGGLWWAIDRGQFEDIESEGQRILKDS
jgi:cbb3-type cytochrome oxidase maturation protein